VILLCLVALTVTACHKPREGRKKKIKKALGFFPPPRFLRGVIEKMGSPGGGKPPPEKKKKKKTRPSQKNKFF